MTDTPETPEEPDAQADRPDSPQSPAAGREDAAGSAAAESEVSDGEGAEPTDHRADATPEAPETSRGNADHPGSPRPSAAGPENAAAKTATDSDAGDGKAAEPGSAGAATATGVGAATDSEGRDGESAGSIDHQYVATPGTPEASDGKTDRPDSPQPPATGRKDAAAKTAATDSDASDGETAGTTDHPAATPGTPEASRGKADHPGSPQPPATGRKDAAAKTAATYSDAGDGKAAGPGSAGAATASRVGVGEAAATDSEGREGESAGTTDRPDATPETPAATTAETAGSEAAGATTATGVDAAETAATYSEAATTDSDVSDGKAAGPGSAGAATASRVGVGEAAATDSEASIGESAGTTDDHPAATPGTAEVSDGNADRPGFPRPSATGRGDAAESAATDSDASDGEVGGLADDTPLAPLETSVGNGAQTERSGSPQSSTTGREDAAGSAAAESEVSDGEAAGTTDHRLDTTPESLAGTAVAGAGSEAAGAAYPVSGAGTGGGPVGAAIGSGAGAAATSANGPDATAPGPASPPPAAGRAGPWPPGPGPAPGPGPGPAPGPGPGPASGPWPGPAHGPWPGHAHGPWPGHAHPYGAPPQGGHPSFGYPPYPGGPPYGGWPPRPAPPRPKRPLPQTPGWLLPAALAAGLVSALVMPLARPGLGLAVAGLVITAAVLRAARGRYSVWTTGYGALACLLLLSSTVIDAGWVVSLNLVAAFGLASLAVSGGGRSWFGLLRGGVSVLIAAPSVPRFLSAPLRGATARRRWLPILISAAVTVATAGLFGLLFASADPAFAHFAGRFLAFGSLPTLPVRLFIFAAATALVGAASLVAMRPVVNPSGPRVSLRASRGVWAAPLIGLNLLFAAFIAVQVSMLFGGNAHVLRSANLTYAEYARQGFFQLATVSALVLGIVALAVWLLPRERAGDRKVQAVLLGLLCVLTLVVLTSAMHRLGLYTDMFGLTRLRASVGAAIGWIGTVFVLVLAAGLANLRGGTASWLPRSAVLATGLALALFSLWNPDARIAESQVDRARAERGDDGPDTWYLSSLSADAVPALDGLSGDARSCALRGIDARLGKGESWTAWNASRDHARYILRERPADAATATPCPSSRWDTLY